MNYFLENFDVSHNIRSNIPHAAKRLSFWYKASIHIATTKISSVVLFYQYSITDTNNKPTGYSNILSLDNSIVWRKTAFNVFPTDSTTDKFNNIELTFLFYQNGPGQANEDFYLDDIQFENDISTVSVSIKPNSLALNVLPNPIADHAHLYYDHLVNSTVSSSIFDLTGREVMKLPSVHSASGDGSIPFDCDGLPNGLYYLRFDAGGTVRMRKIIVQH